ncbi:hypothetical protein BRAS3843_520305 [Bradyrhizobium sp. STM 3843]|nr:hypothetical protein BRAS3843_520305 [Bradyrhizobium sp. STM 3843]
MAAAGPSFGHSASPVSDLLKQVIAGFCSQTLGLGHEGNAKLDRLGRNEDGPEATGVCRTDDASTGFWSGK